MMLSWQEIFQYPGLLTGPAEQVGLIVLAMTIVVAAAPGSLGKAMAMTVLGLMLGMIWGEDVSVGVQRQLLGLHLDEERPLMEIIIVFGFLLPLLARSMQRGRPQRPPTLAWLAYHCFFIYETLPALLLMRWPGPSARWVAPLVVAWSAVLWVCFSLTPADLPLCLGVFVVGLVLHEFDCPVPPLLMGLGVALVLEESVRRSLLLSQGDWGTFLQQPRGVVFLGIAAALLVLRIAVQLWKHRRASTT